MDMPRRRSMTELDRFKRRLIRAVARLLIQEKKEEEEIWTQLKIETGSNCKLLWTRMRALTEKKLSHLLAVNDRTVAIPRPARMSLTDWLLFDLVLVHQKIDLIGQDRLPGSKDPEALVNLFELVKKFKIEGLSGDKLAEAWSSATLYYNNNGHQCSPMLLQRRWYQLKELTRAKFYDFWFAYRGTIKRLALAEPHTPSPLQAAIAKTYKHLVTSPFLEWEELIEKRLVTLPEEFERQMIDRTPKRYMRQSVEEGPDLELIEPTIETIDLRLEPDDDNENEESNQAQDSYIEPTVKIKEEPKDTDMYIGEIEEELPKKSIYDSVLESTDIENEKLESMDAELIDDEHADEELYAEEKEIEETIATTLRDQENLLPQITNVFGNVSDANVLSNLETADQSDETEVTEIVNTGERATLGDTCINKDLVTSSNHNININPQGSDDSVNPEINDTVKETTAGNVNDRDKVEIENKTHNNFEDSSKLVPTSDDLNKVDAFSVPSKPDDNNDDVLIIDNTPVPIIIPDSDVDEERMENSDDIIDDIFLPVNTQPTDVEKFTLTNPEARNVVKKTDQITLKSENNEDKKPNIADFSFGQLPNDISFADEGIVYFDEESSNDTSVKTEAEDTPKIDPKLLMLPIVYTTRLDHMAVTNFKHINDKILIETILAKSKPMKLETQIPNTVAEENIVATSIPIKQEPQPHILDEKTISERHSHVPPDDSESDDVKIPDSKKVKASSYLLQKPRSRTYNPIQLCKNPDFNTRLKWLTVGFFTIPRNRGLIKTCKPLTIDVSKAFESKLISGRLYLKPSEVNVKTEPAAKEDVESIQSVTVVPSAMPVQSLIDNSKIPDISAPAPSQLQKPTSDVASTNERNKVINLPDISEIRRINQRLLTAEVTPIQLKNNQPQVPVSIVTSSNTQSCVTKTTVAMSEIDTELLKEADDVRGPPKCVDITKDLPDKTKQNVAVGTDTHMPKRPQGRPFKMMNGKRMYLPRTTNVAWKPRVTREKIPWLTNRNAESVSNKKMEETTLLTLDTLNKMLFLLIDKEEPAVTNQKINKKNKKCDKNHTHTQQDEKNKSVNDSTCQNNNPSEKPSKNSKVKINVRPAEPRAHSNTNTNTPVKIPEPKKKPGYRWMGPHCCWSREKMLELLFTKKQKTVHNCPKNHCKCCCQNLLKDYTARAIKMRESISSKSDKDNEERVMTYISSTVHTVDENAKIPQVVTVPVRVIIHFPPTLSPNIMVERLTDPQVKNFNIIYPSETSRFVPTTDIGLSIVRSREVTPATTTVSTAVATPVTTSLVSPVTTALVSPVPTSDVSPITIEVPPVSLEAPLIPTVRGIETPVSVISGDGRQDLKSPPYKLSRRASAEKQNKIIPLMHEPNKVVRLLTRGNSPPLSKKNVASRRHLMQKSLRRTTTPPNIKSNIPLNSKPSMPPNIAPKNVKEKMIFINSKQITEKPTECPIYLGKNKILLTTVKFPPNLKQFEESKLALSRSLNLPKGVQLTVLADGTVSYTLDKNVPVNVHDIAEMPAIIAAVKAHMNGSQAVPVNVQPAVAEGEVVDLIDDDDDVVTGSTAEHNKNNEPSSVTKEPTEINVNNQNAITDQYTITDMQEGQVQQTSDSKVSLPSAEEVQDQEISGLEHNQLESTTQNISTEVQQPSVEQVSDHSEASKEIIEESNEPASRDNSTDIQKDPDEEEQPTSQPQSEAVTGVDSANEPSRNKSKNILSDLMEMSGIFDEDMSTAAAPVEPVQEEPVLPQPTEQVQPNSERGNASVPLIKSTLGELSPITSLYELKYACMKKGAFFKLDFSTGYLVPINVCMKQNVKQVAPVTPLRTIVTKSVIDLTDDDDALPVPSVAANEHAVDVQISPSTSSRSLLIASNTVGSEAKPVKPVKLYKALTPNILRILDKAKMKRKQAQQELKNKLNDLPIDHKRKRKQVLISDDGAKQISPELETATAISSDDSSDEEPLSNFVKRRKEKDAELQKMNANEPEQNKEIDLEFTDTMEDIDMSDSELASKEALIEVDINQSNDEEEGCILGV